MADELRFGVLGPMQASRGGVSLRLPGSAVARRLLGVLLLADDPLPAQRLIGLAWADRVDGVRKGSLHVGISRLRDWLAAETDGELAVRHEAQGYRLTGGPETVDVRLFRRLVREAAAGDVARRYARLAAATSLARGPVLADLAGLDRDDPLLRAADDAVRGAALDLAAVAVPAGRAEVAAVPLRLVATARPFDEPVHARLIEVLAAAGRPAEALVQFEALRDRLANQLGVDPSPEVRRAHLAVLEADGDAAAAGGRPVPRGRGRAREQPDAGRPAPPDTATRPGRLPPDLPDFTGHEATLEAVRTALTTPPERPGSPVVVVAGQGGVGKTALAVHAAHLVADHFPDGRLFVSLGGARAQPVLPEEALRRVLRTLGDDAGPAPADLEDCVDRYRALLDDRRMLVVLDDASGAAQVRPFLPGGPGCAVLVSTRARLTTLPGVRHVDLDLMAEAEAVALLRRIVGAERAAAEPEALVALVRLCARLPLALRVVGARLAARPHWPIARLVDRLSDERRRLDELAIDDLAVRTGLAVSYHGLDPLARRAFRAIAYLDPPDIAAWTVGALLEVGLPVAEDVVEQLLDVRLVEVTAVDAADVRYRMHDLVRVYGRECALAEDTEQDLRDAVVRAVCLSLRQVERHAERLPIAVPRLYRPPLPVEVDESLVGASATPARQWLDAEEPGLIAAVERAAELGLDHLACALADALVYASFAVHNDFASWKRAHQAALGVARSNGNLRAEAVIECGLGQLSYKEDGFAQAKLHFGRALELFRGIGDERGETVATNGLGTVCRELGEHSVALELHHRAVAALERDGDEEGAAHAYYGLGYMHRELGDDDRAFENLRIARELYRRVGHVRGEATAVRGLGLVHRARGELEPAEELCAEAHRMATAAGDRLLSCYTGQGLAKVWIRQRRTELAAAPLAEALVACGELRDRLGVALVRRTLGEMHLAAGRPDAALLDLAEAEERWVELGHELWRARTLRDLGAAHAALGDAAAAHRAWAGARATFERFGTRERAELTGWRLSWGCGCAADDLEASGGCRRPAVSPG